MNLRFEKCPVHDEDRAGVQRSHKFSMGVHAPTYWPEIDLKATDFFVDFEDLNQNQVAGRSFESGNLSINSG